MIQKRNVQKPTTTTMFGKPSGGGVKNERKVTLSDDEEEISHASSHSSWKRENRFQQQQQHSDHDRSRSGSSSTSSRHPDALTRSRASSSRSPKSERDELGSLDMAKTLRRPLNQDFSKSKRLSFNLNGCVCVNIVYYSD